MNESPVSCPKCLAPLEPAEEEVLVANQAHNGYRRSATTKFVTWRCVQCHKPRAVVSTTIL